MLQDSYKDTLSKDKMNHIEEFYNGVWKDSSGSDTFYINFTSCVGLANPKLIAKEVNPKFQSFVSKNRSKKFGIVLMDNPDSALIQDIYSLN